MKDQLLAFMDDWNKLGECSMKPETVKKFLSDHRSQLWILGFLELERKRHQAITALTEELTAVELKVLKELDDFGLAFIEASMHFAYEHAVLSAYNQICQQNPSETPFKDFMAIIEDLEPEKAPLEQRLASDHMNVCGNQLRLQLQTRYYDEELEQWLLLVFDVMKSWYGRQPGFMEISFYINYCYALQHAKPSASDAQKRKISKLIRAMKEEFTLHIVQEYEDLNNAEYFEGLAALEGLEDW